MSTELRTHCPDCTQLWQNCHCNDDYEDRECGWPGCGCEVYEVCSEVEDGLGLVYCPECGGELSWFQDSQNRLQSWCDECSW
jgi:hypothetical protein